MTFIIFYPKLVEFEKGADYLEICMVGSEGGY